MRLPSGDHAGQPAPWRIPVRTLLVTGAVVPDREDRRRPAITAVGGRTRVGQSSAVRRPGDLRRERAAEPGLLLGDELSQVGERRQMNVSPARDVDDVEADVGAHATDLVKREGDTPAVRRPIDARQLTAEDRFRTAPDDPAAASRARISITCETPFPGLRRQSATPVSAALRRAGGQAGRSPSRDSRAAGRAPQRAATPALGGCENTPCRGRPSSSASCARSASANAARGSTASSKSTSRAAIGSFTTPPRGTHA